MLSTFSLSGTRVGVEVAVGASGETAGCVVTAGDVVGFDIFVVVVEPSEHDVINNPEMITKLRINIKIFLVNFITLLFLNC
jgi:hypothetical protein